jgi:hypothetical protein
MPPKWKTPVVSRGASEVHIQAASWNASDNITADQSYKPFVKLGDAAHHALAAVWWRLRAEGIHLPAERGVIVVIGGRP